MYNLNSYKKMYNLNYITMILKLYPCIYTELHSNY